MFYIQWNLCNPTPEFSDILWHPTKIYGPKVFLLTKIKPEYSDILYNQTHFPGSLLCRIGQVSLYLIFCLILIHVYFFFFLAIHFFAMYIHSTLNKLKVIYVLCFRWTQTYCQPLVASGLVVRFVVQPIDSKEWLRYQII